MRQKQKQKPKQQEPASKRVATEQSGVPLLYPRFTSLEALQSAAAASTSAAPTGGAGAAPHAAGSNGVNKRKADEQPSTASLAPEGGAEGEAQPGQKQLTKFEIKRMKRAARRQGQLGQAEGGAAAAAAVVPSTQGEGQQQQQQQQQQAEEQEQQQADTANAGKTSGKGNAGEAQRIREALGYAAQTVQQESQAAGTSAAAAASVPASAQKEGPQRKKKKGKKAAAAADAAAEAAKATEDVEAATAMAEPVASTSAPTVTAAPGGKGKGFSFGFKLVQAQVEAQTEAKLNHIMMMDSATKDGYVPRRVFVCGMPHEFDEATVREYWGYCGEIESLDMMVFPDSGNFNGVMFITFKTEEGYQSALACNGEELEGRTLRVERCKAAAAKKVMQASSTAAKPAAELKRTEGYNVAYAGNIAYDTTREELMELFKPYGATLVRLHTDKDTGKPKGYAHIHFPDAQSLDGAMKLNGHELNGRGIKLSYAQPKRNA